MLDEFECLKTPLIVEIVRSNQTPRSSSASNCYAADQSTTFDTTTCAPITTASQQHQHQQQQPQQQHVLRVTCLEYDLECFLDSDAGNQLADIVLHLRAEQQQQQSQSETPPTTTATLLAHKCILAARCSYFEAYFRSFMPKERKVEVGWLMTKLCLFSLCNYCYFICSMKDNDWWRRDGLAALGVSRPAQVRLLRRGAEHQHPERSLPVLGKPLLPVLQHALARLLQADTRDQRVQVQRFRCKCPKSYFSSTSICTL